MANIFNINDKSILATASITITDQTDASDLGGGILVISGSKNQVFLTDTSTLSPDWTKNNLVLRPYVYASNVTRQDGDLTSYNPDLFDPNEYPDLNKPGDNNVSTPYINTDNLKWYIRDVNGTETIIDETNENFSFSYTLNDTVISDKRYLVIKNNFVPKDSFMTIVCKFVFYDPFAKIYVNQNYEIDLSCLSTGMGTNQLVIHSVNGTSIHNSSPAYIELYASYFKNGVEIDVQQEIEDTTKSSELRWFIRSSSGKGWTLLDGSKQKNEQQETLFEVHRHTVFDDKANRYVTEKTLSTRGGHHLIIYPGLIEGSNVIKAVFTASDEGNVSHSALEVVYDTTDEIQAYIHSSNGDKIYQGINSTGTTLTCMIKYQGQLLAADDLRYEENFEYYWFKVSADGSQTWNVWTDDEGKMQFKLVDEEDTEMIPSSRILPVKAENVEYVNMFQCAIIDKVSVQLAEQRSNLILNSPSEEDLYVASILNRELGIEDDSEALLNTAYEINATHIADGTSLKN